MKSVIGRLIKELRMKHPHEGGRRDFIPQDVAAEKCGVALKTIAMMENGKWVRRHIMEQVLDGLKATPKERGEILAEWAKLTIGAENWAEAVEHIARLPKATNTDPVSRRIYAAVGRLTPEQREALADVVEAPALIGMLQPIRLMIDAASKKT